MSNIYISRRNVHERKIPAHLKDYCVLALHAESYVEDVPSYHADINSRHDKKEWQKVVKEELKAIYEN